jgi:hypothetical protein
MAHAVSYARVNRVSAFPPIKNVDVLADRFNLTTPAALRAFVRATPYGLIDGLEAGIRDDVDYGRGFDTAALMKAPPIHAARCRLSTMIRDYTAPGHVWWTDISNAHPEDFAGHTYSRLFAEERTGHASTYYSCRKDAASLIESLKAHITWIGQTVPGGRLSVLRCDFGSEIVRQGHGDAIMTAEVRAFCDAAGIIVVPVAPHSQALNRAENT